MSPNAIIALAAILGWLLLALWLWWCFMVPPRPRRPITVRSIPPQTRYRPK